MLQNRLEFLLERYGNNQLTPSEMSELQHYIQSSGSGDDFEQAADTLFRNSESHRLPEDTAAYNALIREVIKTDLPRKTAAPVKVLWPKRVAAAAAVVLVALAAWKWLAVNSTHNKQKEISQISDIAPGKDGAVLTLADGRQLLLDSAGNGVVATQNGTTVMLANGQLSYNTSGDKAAELVYNTMTTPKGRQFKLVLPDGSLVWLNAASAIRFPTQFTGKEREVQLTGEAYFEIAANARQPFVVVSGSQQTLVLGTAFNINAYNNESSIKTTLLQGSIQISRQANNVKDNQQKVLLIPGQQSQLSGQQLQVVKNADISKVMAWKNGLFNFEGASLQEVMKQIERWYDIEVVYENGIPDISFFGKMGKDITLLQLLEALKSSGINYKIENDKKLIIK